MGSTWQADGIAPGGVSVAYLSLCLGMQQATSWAWYVRVDMAGNVSSPPFTRGCLRAAMENGITCVVLAYNQVCGLVSSTVNRPATPRGAL